MYQAVTYTSVRTGMKYKTYPTLEVFLDKALECVIDEHTKPRKAWVKPTTFSARGREYYEVAMPCGRFSCTIADNDNKVSVETTMYYNGWSMRDSKQVSAPEARRRFLCAVVGHLFESGKISHLDRNRALETLARLKAE